MVTFLKYTFSRPLAASFRGSFSELRSILAHKLEYFKYDMPATRQYAEAAAEDDMTGTIINEAGTIYNQFIIVMI